MEKVKVYLDERFQGMTICLKCGSKKKIDLLSFSNSNNNIVGRNFRGKCNCGYIFDVMFEFRRYHRKQVNLPGKILQIHPRREIDKIVIASLSVVGIGFVVRRGTVIQIGNSYEVIFSLDDPDKSVICEEIIVKRIHNNFIGAEFYHDNRYSHELDFYLYDTTALQEKD